MDRGPNGQVKEQEGRRHVSRPANPGTPATAAMMSRQALPHPQRVRTGFLRLTHFCDLRPPLPGQRADERAHGREAPLGILGQSPLDGPGYPFRQIGTQGPQRYRLLIHLFRQQLTEPGGLVGVPTR